MGKNKLTKKQKEFIRENYKALSVNKIAQKLKITKKIIIEIFDLFLISFLSLFFEIMLIRWIQSEVRVIAYFTNIILIACFLGLGIGCAIADRKVNFLPFFSIFICFLLLSVSIGAEKLRYMSYPGSSDEFFWFFRDVEKGWAIIKFYLVICLFFLLSVISLLPLGQTLGKYLKKFPSLTSYTINISGSLFGIIAFSIISFLNLSPLYWFSIGLIIYLLFFRNNIKLLIIESLIIAISLIIFSFNTDKALWSPYHKINISPLKISNESKQHSGFNLNINHDFYQVAFNSSEDFMKKHPDLLKIPAISSYASSYNLPYKFIKPKNVLVVGAGTGNEVATALRNGVNHIDAVDIDPVIVNLGKKMHPEKPYSSQKVSIFIDDARAFLQKTNSKYDLIVFGLLDAHSLFSSMSTIRLDSYVYTLESFNAAKRCLTDNGILSVSFSVGKLWIGQRIYSMLKSVFKKEPLIYGEGEVIITGPGINGFKNTNGLVNHNYKKSVNPATDDWPYLYLKERKIPRVYIHIIIILIIISFILVFISIPERRKINFHFFFLGSAFMLIETKSITQLALFFGSTWLVNSIVIGSILCVILLANYYVGKVKNISESIYYIPLLISLLLNYYISFNNLFYLGITLGSIISCIIISIPIFFAGIIFAFSFKKSKNPDISFGSNLLGAVIGGLCEYMSLIYGMKSLVFLILVFYIFSFLFIFKNKE